MAEAQKKGHVGELTIVNYSAMYIPVSMVLLPLGVYVIPYYVELGISLYTISAIIFAALIEGVALFGVGLAFLMINQ